MTETKRTETCHTCSGRGVMTNHSPVLPPTCQCACHHGEGEFCACSPDECDPRLQDDTRPPLPPTCQKCGGLGHEQDWHNLVSWPDIAQKHARELRALANDLRRNEEHIAQTSARGIARSARADTYEMVADRLEKDAEKEVVLSAGRATPTKAYTPWGA